MVGFHVLPTYPDVSTEALHGFNTEMKNSAEGVCGFTLGLPLALGRLENSTDGERRKRGSAAAAEKREGGVLVRQWRWFCPYSNCLLIALN